MNVTEQCCYCCSTFHNHSRVFNVLKAPCLQVLFTSVKAKKKNMCAYYHMSKKSRVGRSALIFFFFLLSAKPEIVVPGS